MPKSECIRIFNSSIHNNSSRRLTMHHVVAIVVLVGSFASFAAQAATTPISPDLRESVEPSTATPEEIERAQLLELSPAPPRAERQHTETDFFFSYRNAFSLRTGVEVLTSDLENPGPVLGLLYWYPMADLRGMEAGVDLGRDGAGTIHLAFRHIFGDGRFRRFYKLGGGIRVVASEQLVTFIRPRNWQFRASGGIEWTLSGPVSLRCDLEGILGTELTKAQGTLGLAMAW